MILKSSMLAASLLSLTTLNVEASLTPYTSDGKALVYSSRGGITVTADANLLGTMIGSQGYNTVVNAIIAASPVIADTPNYYDGNVGSYSISGADFATVADFGGSAIGRTTWFGAQAFVGYLNTINYAGSNQWRLPTWTDTGAPGAQAGYNGTDYGFNVNTSSGELAKLYYDELGKTAAYNSNGAGPQPNSGILGTSTFLDTTGSTGPFSKVHTYAYWLGTEVALFPNSAWDFDPSSGGQFNSGKTTLFYAWAVSPGQVAAVPVPGAVWLMGTGLLGLQGLKRRGHAG